MLPQERPHPVTGARGKIDETDHTRPPVDHPRDGRVVETDRWLRAQLAS